MEDLDNTNGRAGRKVGQILGTMDDGDRSNTVSESTFLCAPSSVSFWPSPKSWERLTEVISSYECAPIRIHKGFTELGELIQNSVALSFRNSALETVCCLFLERGLKSLTSLEIDMLPHTHVSANVPQQTTDTESMPMQGRHTLTHT